MKRIAFFALILAALSACGDGAPGIFSANGYHIGKDKVWYKSSTGMDYHVDVVEGADPKTFHELDIKSQYTGESFHLGADAKGMYWTAYRIEGLDVPSFEYLFSAYFRDKNALFFRAQVLSRDPSHAQIVGDQFLKDSEKVYFGSDVFSDDAPNFVQVGAADSRFFKDTKTCWYDIVVIKGADPATFRYVGPSTAADAQHVYFESNPVEGVEAKSYRILSEQYSVDAKHAYLKGQVIDGADPGSFAVKSDQYAVDQQHCYYDGFLLKDADPGSLKIIDHLYAKDARRVYLNGNVIPDADPATFRVLNSEAGCSCDAKYAYTLLKKVQGADPKKFPTDKPCKLCTESKVEFE